MRIGIDVDGVLANFFKAYEALTIEVTGRDLFGANRWPEKLPQTWNWPESYGYTGKEMREVWGVIKGDNYFWMRMEPFEGTTGFVNSLFDFDGEYYFITDRPGRNPQQQTSGWFDNNFGLGNASIIISGPHARKGQICAGLAITHYLDDKGENILDVLDKSPSTKAVLLSYPYNQEFHSAITDRGGIIIDQREEFLDILSK